MGKVLVVYYSIGGNTRLAAEAVVAGAQSVVGGDVDLKSGLEATLDDLFAADAVAFGTGDYFSTMLGGLKDFFDRTYYGAKGKVAGKPAGVFITHGGGGRAVDSVVKMCERYELSMVREPVLVQNAPDASAKEALSRLGKALAEAAG